MESVPAVPGLPDSADPFADPLIGMGFVNFAVLKIGNVSTSFGLLASLIFLRSLMEPPRKKSPTSSVVMLRPI
jgi:hypothetical protein